MCLPTAPDSLILFNHFNSQLLILSLDVLHGIYPLSWRVRTSLSFFRAAWSAPMTFLIVSYVIRSRHLMPKHLFSIFVPIMPPLASFFWTSVWAVQCSGTNYCVVDFRLRVPPSLCVAKNTRYSFNHAEFVRSLTSLWDPPTLETQHFQISEACHFLQRIINVYRTVYLGTQLHVLGLLDS